MATTEDGIPIVPSKSYISGSIPNNPAQQLANSVPPDIGCDPGFSVAENIFNKSRLDASLEQMRSDRSGKSNNPGSYNSPKADY